MVIVSYHDNNIALLLTITSDKAKSFI